MAYIDLPPEGDAQGQLARIYDAARQRAGRVWNILKIQSRRPGQLEASMALYREIMFGESNLSRQERELVAVVVSATNGCFY